ncbi:MAG: AtpZ/AtpI family protein [Planctomycetota bacterium]|nr:AtpZ/AtpI family protein [Planctomycetota bacterium]
MTEPTPKRPPAHYVGLGFQLALPIVLGAFGGRWLDAKLGTTPWLVVVGSLLGIAAGFWNFFRAALPALGRGPGEGDDR